METKRLIETENSIQEFTVQFYGGTLMTEQNQLPLGQISCELLDHPVEELLALHDEAVRLFSIVRDSLFARDKEKSPALAAAVPFPVSWTVKMKKKQKETQDILSYHSQAAGCSDKARAKASGGRQPIEECGRTGL